MPLDWSGLDERPRAGEISAPLQVMDSIAPGGVMVCDGGHRVGVRETANTPLRREKRNSHPAPEELPIARLVSERATYCLRSLGPLRMWL